MPDEKDVSKADEETVPDSSLHAESEGSQSNPGHPEDAKEKETTPGEHPVAGEADEGSPETDPGGWEEKDTAAKGE